MPTMIILATIIFSTGRAPMIFRGLAGTFGPWPLRRFPDNLPDGRIFIFHFRRIPVVVSCYCIIMNYRLTITAHDFVRRARCPQTSLLAKSCGLLPPPKLRGIFLPRRYLMKNAHGDPGTGNTPPPRTWPSPCFAVNSIYR